MTTASKTVRNLARNRESFRAFVVEVCEVNLGRLDSLKSQLPANAIPYLEQFERSMANLKIAAKTDKYPGVV